MMGWDGMGWDGMEEMEEILCSRGIRCRDCNELILIHWSDGVGSVNVEYTLICVNDTTPQDTSDQIRSDQTGRNRTSSRYAS